MFMVHMANILLRTYSTNLFFFLLEKQDLSFSSVFLSPPIFHWFYESASAQTSFKKFLQFDIAAAVRQFFSTNLCCRIFIGPRVCKEYYGIERQFTSFQPRTFPQSCSYMTVLTPPAIVCFTYMQRHCMARFTITCIIQNTQMM